MISGAGTAASGFRYRGKSPQIRNAVTAAAKPEAAVGRAGTVSCMSVSGPRKGARIVADPLASESHERAAAPGCGKLFAQTDQEAR